MIVQSNLTAAAIRNFLNNNYIKKSNKQITLGDVQGYVRRGKTPKWVGDYLIVRNEFITSAKLYHLITDNNEVQ